MPRYTRGLVIGKFSPLHKGHEFLINTALEACSEVVIFSYSLPEFEGCEAVRRKEWLEKAFPEARIFVITSEEAKATLGLEMPENEFDDLRQRIFACELWQKLIDEPLAAIFTSEEYGEGFARFFADYFRERKWPDVRHVMVDPDRKGVPISGRQLRQDIHGLRKMLSSQVYSSFVRTVCFLGGESTGKSTLARMLAERYETEFVAEYGRTLWEQSGGELNFENLLTIARTHIAVEEQSRLSAHKFLFIDTSPLTTQLYGDWLFGKTDDELANLAKRKYDHIFLCAPDFPFVQDGTRQGETFRLMQHQRYLVELESRELEFVLLEGSLEWRIQKVKRKLNEGSGIIGNSAFKLNLPVAK